MSESEPTSSKIVPVILSGGSGTRLWPLSREFYPKQLLSLSGEHSLLQDTVLRLADFEEAGKPVVVCNEEHRFLVAEQLRELGIEPGRILLEPVGRNTAPALALVALDAMMSNRDPVLLVMPADHVIPDRQALHATIAEGIRFAEEGKLVAFGIVPSSPATGYGYIRAGADHAVAAFVEKPDQQTAEKYLQSGDCLWNSGMFMVKASVWVEELGRFRKDILDATQAAYAAGTRDLDFFRVPKTEFAAVPAESIDYAVMEKTDRAVVLPLDAGWSDIGAWSVLWEVSQQDEAGNARSGDTLVHETRDSLVMAQHRMVATVGIDNLIVVETPDAVLVCHKERAQDVKQIVAQLKESDRSEYRFHRRVYRPWGSYEGVDLGERFQVKRLSVKPGAALSLQRHQHRAEHWVVVRGTAKVTRGEEEIVLTENQSTYIPLGMKHRLENPGKIALEIVEVQSGSYLGEDDIERFDDRYNRHQHDDRDRE
jgi:mannose-1-phosphate guanylyltransferase/mannose-6-phosphate isomerase